MSHNASRQSWPTAPSRYTVSARAPSRGLAGKCADALLDECAASASSASCSLALRAPQARAQSDHRSTT